MARPRYIVATVSGYPYKGSTAGGNSKVGLSAHVCDTLYLHEVVKTYRSTDSAPIPGYEQRRLGVEGARAAAEEHAERLNRDTA